MTTQNRECCGNCAAFMPDPFNFGDQGACAMIDDDNIAYGTYNWTTADGDCNKWTQRTKVEVVRCRDCKFRVPDFDTVDITGNVICTGDMCSWLELWVKPDGYCAWACRKEPK